MEKTGQTPFVFDTLEILVYVESNGILKTIEQTLYVGDIFDTFQFEEIPDDLISIGATSAGMNLTPVGITNQGRHVLLEEVLYEVSDESIAKIEVQEDGRIRLIPLQSG